MRVAGSGLAEGLGDRCIAGHVDDGSGRCIPYQNGVTYHVSSWRDPDGHRLILLSEMCRPGVPAATRLRSVVPGRKHRYC